MLPGIFQGIGFLPFLCKRRQHVLPEEMFRNILSSGTRIEEAKESLQGDTI